MVDTKKLDSLAIRIRKELGKKDLYAEDVIYIAEKLKMQTYRDTMMHDIDSGFHLRDFDEEEES